MRGGWLLLIGVTACGGTADAPDSSDQSLAGDTAPMTQPAAPTSLAELAPGDTLGVLALMRATINNTNAAAATATRRDTIMPPEGYREARTLSLWRVGETPVKLVATEPNDAGLMRLESITWFVNGEITVVQEPFAIHLFDADRLTLWTDEAMVPQDVLEADRMARERSVVDSVKARLAVFGIGYP